MLVMSEILFYYCIRALMLPIQWLPYSWIHFLGRFFGPIAYHLLTTYRKRTLSNLALAKTLNLSNPQIIQTAKRSFQNLAINCLEYAKLAKDKTLNKTIQCENPEVADALYAKGQGIIFFCGHQANWEVLFLDGTSRMKGVAIGKSIKNKKLYQWIIRMREKNGGKIISPLNAVREGFRSLKKGTFLGIVGDQGMPNSGYSFPFLGRKAWTSTAPALLSYRTGCPLIFAETRRVNNQYKIRYSDPIWPDLNAQMEPEIIRLMDSVLHLLQASIQKNPAEWLWQHNRWKQQTPKNVYKQFRHDCIALILVPGFEYILPTIKQIYPTDFLTLIIPNGFSPNIEADEIITYNYLSEAFLPDYRFKLVFNFTNVNFRHHYLSLSAHKVLDFPIPHENLPETLKKTLCRRPDAL